MMQWNEDQAALLRYFVGAVLSAYEAQGVDPSPYDVTDQAVKGMVLFFQQAVAKPAPKVEIQWPVHL